MKTDITHIDTRLGTDNHSAYSNGNTLPYTGVPFGMNYFLPQTTHEQDAWFFNPNPSYLSRYSLDPSAQPLDWRFFLVSPHPADRHSDSRRPLFQTEQLPGPFSALEGRLHFHWPFIAPMDQLKQNSEKRIYIFTSQTKIIPTNKPILSIFMSNLTKPSLALTGQDRI